MKLIDVINLIPKETEFYVEEYDDRGNMTYAWRILPYGRKRRDSLKCAYDEEVIKIYAGKTNAFGNSSLIIEVRYSEIY